MKNFKSKKSNNKIFLKIIFLTIGLVIFLTLFLLAKFNSNMNDSLKKISEAEVKRVTYRFITDRINNEVINNDAIKDILIINKNSEGKIIYVDFNLDKAYKILDDVSGILTTALDNIENGSIDVNYLDKELTHKSDGMVLMIPIGNSFKNTYFYNMGPKIPVKINFIGSVLTNLKTKITNYGMNNALVEVYVFIEFNNEILTPFRNSRVELCYDAIISSMMINGEVPEFYNGTLEKETTVYKNFNL